MKTFRILAIAAAVALTLTLAGGTAQAGEPFHPIVDYDYYTYDSIDFWTWYFGW